MGPVPLRCEKCGETTTSSLFYRGQGQHRCRECGGQLRLADAGSERRSGVDRRRRRMRRWPDFRYGDDRREAG